MLSKSSAQLGPSAPGCRSVMSASTATKSTTVMTTVVIHCVDRSNGDLTGLLPGRFQDFDPHPPDFTKALRTGHFPLDLDPMFAE